MKSNEEYNKEALERTQQGFRDKDARFIAAIGKSMQKENSGMVLVADSEEISMDYLITCLLEVIGFIDKKGDFNAYYLARAKKLFADNKSKFVCAIGLDEEGDTDLVTPAQLMQGPLSLIKILTNVIEKLKKRIEDVENN